MEKSNVEYLNFFSDQEIKDLLKNDKKSFIGIIPKGIIEEKELMQVYYDKLNLAPYFGGNWDALDEVLIDFDWINAETIIILHLELPALDIKDQKKLITGLGEAVKIMQEGARKEIQLPTGKHKLQVIFPKSSETEIKNL